LWAHPVTLLVLAAIAAVVVAVLFGLLKALRGPIGSLAYLGLMATFWAYWVMKDRYWSQNIWVISIGCLAVMVFTVQRVPFLRTVLAVALVEFGYRINKTAYPHQTVYALGLIAAIIAIATFWTPRYQQPTAPPPPPRPTPPAAYRRRPERSRRGPERFDPYSGRPLPQQRDARVTPAKVWRWARGQR
jgi:hypothetical protein